MIKIGFDDAMLNELSGIKGKTLKSIEYEAMDKFGTPYGAVRLNLGRFSIDFTCLNRDVGSNYYDEIPVLECEKKELNSEFFYGTETFSYMINEKIKSVSIITDEIAIDEIGEFSVDDAILIETSYGEYSLSKNWYLSECVVVKYDSDCYSSEKALSDWKSGIENKGIKCKRVIKNL